MTTPPTKMIQLDQTLGGQRSFRQGRQDEAGLSCGGVLGQRHWRGRHRRSPMARHKIAILVGSLRKDSLNRKVARSICAFASDKLDCEIVEIGDLPLYNQDYDADSPAEYVAFR